MNLFDKIYDMTYLPLVTPHNLVDNIKLDNYIEIRYKKNNGAILCEIDCDIDTKNVTFYYQFSENDFLEEIYFYEEENKNILFNRNEELTMAKENYHEILLEAK